MSDKPKFTQTEIDAFTRVLHHWADGLPPNQKLLLNHLLDRGRASGELSLEELESITGGLAAPPSRWIQEAPK